MWKDNTRDPVVTSGRLPDSVHHSGQQEWQYHNKELIKEHTVHRTLLEQIRTLKAVIRQNCNRDLTMIHALTPKILLESGLARTLQRANPSLGHTAVSNAYTDEYNADHHSTTGQGTYISTAEAKRLSATH